MAKDVSDGRLMWKMGADLSDLDRATDKAKEKFDEVSKTAEKAGQKIDKAFSPGKPKEFKSVLESLAGTIDQNEKYLAELINEQKAHATALERGKKVTSEYIAKQGQLSQEIQYVRQMLQLQRAEMSAGAGSIAAMEARVKMLSLSYKQLSTAEQQGVVGKRLREEIAQANKELEKAQKQMGAAGTAASGMAGRFSKAFGILRQIAHMIPGLGIAGVIGIIATAVGDLIKKLGTLGDKLTEAQQKQKLAGEITVKAYEDYAKLSTQVSILTDRVRQGGKSFEDKNRILNDYNEWLGEALGKVQSYEEAEKNIITKTPAFLQAIRLRAEEVAALETAIEASKEGMRIRYSDPEEFLSGMDKFFLRAEKAAARIPLLGSTLFRGSEKEAQATIQRALIEQDKAEKKQDEIYRRSIGRYEELRKQREAADKQAKQLLITLDNETKKQDATVNKIYNDAKKVRDLLEEISASKDKFTIQFAPQYESEQQKINKYFDDLKRKVDEFNKDPKRKVKLTDAQIEQASREIEDLRRYALGLSEYKQDTAELIKELKDAQKQYQEYEDFKRQYGENVADELYASLIKKHKDFLSRLMAEKSAVEAIGGLDPLQHDRLRQIDDLIVQENERIINSHLQAAKERVKQEEEAYRKILQKAKDFNIQRENLEREYQDAIKALERKKLSPEERSKELAAIEKYYKDRLADISIAAEELFGTLDENFERFTKGKIRGLINEISRMIKTGKFTNKLGELIDIPPDQLERLKEALDVLLDIQRQTSSLSRTARALDDVAASFAQIAMSFGGRRSESGEFFANISRFVSQLADTIDRLQSGIDAMKRVFSTSSKTTIEDVKDLYGLIVSVVTMVVNLANGFEEYYEHLGNLKRELAEFNARVYLGEYKITEQMRQQNMLQAESIELTRKQLRERLKVAEANKRQIEEEAAALMERIKKEGDYILFKYIDEPSGLGKLFGKKASIREVYGSMYKYRIKDVIDAYQRAGVSDQIIQELLGTYAEGDFINAKTLELLAKTSTALTGRDLFLAAKGLEELNKSAEKIAVTWEELKALDAEGRLTGATKELYDQLAALEQQGVDVENVIKGINDELSVNFTGTTSDAILDSIVDGFKRGLRSAEDFADSFEEMMRDAMLNSLKYNYLQEPIQEFYKRFAEMTQSGDTLTESEIQQLREYYNEIIQNANQQLDNLKQITGINDIGGGRNKNTMAGAFSAASQESIDLLAGHTMGMRVAQLKTNELLEAGFLDMGQLMSRGIDKLDNIERNTYNTYNELKILNNKIQGASDVALAIGGV